MVFLLMEEISQNSRIGAGEDRLSDVIIKPAKFSDGDAAFVPRRGIGVPPMFARRLGSR